MATSTNVTTVVPGSANPADTSQINVTSYGGQLVTNPSLGLTGDNPATTNKN